MSAKDALNKFYERQHKKQQRESQPRRRNAKPEAEVQRLVLEWLRAKGFSMNVVEAKATYSHAAGRYISGQTVPGVPDLFGCAPGGMSCFIELKAPGRISTLRSAQRAFLVEKIKLGCFAAVIDSVERLSRTWQEFEHRRAMEPALGVNYLIRQLPSDKAADPLFFD